MKQQQRKQRIIESTLKICSEKGLVPFSVKQVSRYCSINEALIYRDFSTRENLLHESYKYVIGKHEALFDGINKEEQKDPYIIWKTYVKYMVSEPEETLFLMDYMEFYTMTNHSAQTTYDDFKGMLKIYIKQTHRKLSAVAWDFLIVNSIRFSTWIILGKTKNTEKRYLEYWNLMAKGFENSL